MTGPEQASFISSTFGMLLVMQQEDLPTPLSLGWDVLHNTLDVQVAGEHFDRWVKALTEPVLESEEHEGSIHRHAEGRFRLRPLPARVRLVAVAHGGAVHA